MPSSTSATQPKKTANPLQKDISRKHLIIGVIFCLIFSIAAIALSLNNRYSLNLTQLEHLSAQLSVELQQLKTTLQSDKLAQQAKIKQLVQELHQMHFRQALATTVYLIRLADIHSH